MSVTCLLRLFWSCVTGGEGFRLLDLYGALDISRSVFMATVDGRADRFVLV